MLIPYGDQVKILITGANGFLGHWMARRLRDEGHETFALLRNLANIDELKQLGIYPVLGDITNRDSVFSACKNMDGVFHLAGLVAYTRRDRTSMIQVNYHGTKNIVDACIELKVPRLLHVSSVAAVGASFSPNVILNETSPFNLRHLHLGYFDTKHAAEMYVRRATRFSKLSAVIVNPSTIYGAGDAKKGSRGTQLKVARGKFLFYTGGGANVVAVEDVIDAMWAAWQKGASGERYILCGENILIKDLFTKIAKAAGVNPPKILMPNSALKMLGIAGDLLEKCGQKAPLSSETAWISQLYHWFSNEKAKKELGFKTRSADIAIENSVRWCKDNHLI